MTAGVLLLSTWLCAAQETVPAPLSERAVEASEGEADQDAPADETTADAAAQAASARQLLVMTTVAVGDVEAEASIISQALPAAVEARSDRPVLAQAELRSALDLQATREVLGCETDDACMAAISERLNADRLLTSRLGKVGDRLSLTLVLQAPQTVETLGRVDRTGTSIAELLDVLGGALGELLGGKASAAPARASAFGEGVSVAVFPLQTTGVSADVATNLSEVIGTELKRIDGLSVVGLSDVKALLEVESTRASLGCSDDASCLAEIGGALGVDKIVSGEVGRVGDQFVLGLRVIDRDSVRVDRRVTETFFGAEEQLLRAVRSASRRLMGVVVDDVGTLLLTSNQSGSIITVDAEERGRSPGPPIEGLAPGKHTVRVSASGFYDWQGDVYIDPGEVTAQWVELEEEPRLIRPFIPWWAYLGGWGVTGVAAAVAVGAAGAGAFFVFSYQQLASGAVIGTDGKIPGDELIAAYNNAILSGVVAAGFGVATVTLGLATGAATLAVDWGAE
jgi:TolB-like protein